MSDLENDLGFGADEAVDLSAGSVELTATAPTNLTVPFVSSPGFMHRIFPAKRLSEDRVANLELRMLQLEDKVKELEARVADRRNCIHLHIAATAKRCS